MTLPSPRRPVGVVAVAWCLGIALGGHLWLRWQFDTRDDIVAGYLGYMAVFMAYLVVAFAILAVHGLRGSETSGRADPVLATPASRQAWLGSNLTVTALGAVISLAAAGVGTGAFAAIVMGEASHLLARDRAEAGSCPPPAPRH